MESGNVILVMLRRVDCKTYVLAQQVQQLTTSTTITCVKFFLFDDSEVFQKFFIEMKSHFSSMAPRTSNYGSIEKADEQRPFLIASKRDSFIIFSAFLAPLIICISILCLNRVLNILYSRIGTTWRIIGILIIFSDEIATRAISHIKVFWCSPWIQLCHWISNAGNVAWFVIWL